MNHFHEKIRRTKKRSKNQGLFRNENGAIDLASIMVGVIVIGLIGGVIASTIFVVIPWTQDNAAKQQLDSIASAESAYMGMSSANPSPLPAGYAPNSFGNTAQLAAANLLQAGPTYCAVTPADGKSYTGYSKSDSGTFWVMSDKNTQPAIVTTPIPVECGFAVAGNPVPYVDNNPTQTILTYRCDTAITGEIPMRTNLTGKETWNDGVVRSYTGASGPTTRTLLANTDYTMTFDGTYDTFSGSASTPAQSLSKCLVRMDHWGRDTGVKSALGAFFGAAKLTDVPDNVPPTVTSFLGIFQGTTTFNDPDVNKWNVSSVTNMKDAFFQAAAFNQPLNNWDVSNVTDISGMFEYSGFNQNIDNWDTSKVITMARLFEYNSTFNQPLNSWDVSNVTSLDSAFFSASAYNQPLDKWNITKVTSLRYTFADATAFNQPLNSWKTSNVTNMIETFNGNSGYNQPLNNWNTSNVTSMYAMFATNSKFNQDIGSWNTSKVTDMSYMFASNTKFNQNIRSWIVTQVPSANRINFRYNAVLTAANSPI